MVFQAYTFLRLAHRAGQPGVRSAPPGVAQGGAPGAGDKSGSRGLAEFADRYPKDLSGA